MLTVLTTPDFAAWFQALADARAEEVATGISLIESLGPERSPPGSTEMLLWYEAEPGRSHRFEAKSLAFAQRARRMVHHLSSGSALARLNEVSAERAQRFAVSVALIGKHARRWRREPSPRDVEALMEEYRSALEALGLREPPVPARERRLLELSFKEQRPGLRVLYGVDALRKCALLISGETLDRRAYGPSVRRALAVWNGFLASDGDAPVFAAGSSSK